MPWTLWTIHDVPLWLPSTWTDLDDYLFEVDATIKRYNESRTRDGSRPAACSEDYELKCIKWSPWQTTAWLWRREWVVLRGYRSYLDPAPRIITAVLVERSKRCFDYDGAYLRHIASGDLWCAVQVITSEAYAIECSQGELSFPDEEYEPDIAEEEEDVRPWPIELKLLGRRRDETTAPLAVKAEPAVSPPADAHPGPGRPSAKDQILKIFNDLPDATVADTRTLAAMVRIVGADVPGLDPRTVARHLRVSFKQRRERLKKRTKFTTK